jgi:hypothetical protein
MGWRLAPMASDSRDLGLQRRSLAGFKLVAQASTNDRSGRLWNIRKLHIVRLCPASPAKVSQK